MSVPVDEWLKQQGTTMRRGVDTSQMFVDKEQSESYAKYRMKYCDQVYQFIVDYCRETSPNLDLCVDCGCGPGQSTFGFAKYFKKVVGVDISEVQISNAPKHDNVEFKVGSAEKLPFIESGSVDLWSSAQSFNYMPEKETFAEADRVLKPGGTLVIFGYRKLEGEAPIITEAIRGIFSKLIPYWPEETKPILEKFKDVTLPYPGWIRKEDIPNPHRMTLRDLLGLFASFYSVLSYKQHHPGEDFMGNAEKTLREAHEKVYGPKDDLIFDLSWETFILIGRKPVK